jgi:hypothetical protein
MYIERVLPHLERTGGFPDSPMDRDAKGTSNPPVGDRALALWSLNRDAGAIFNPLLAELRHGRETAGGYQFRDMFDLAVYDTGAFMRWLSVSQERCDAYWKLCVLVAQVARYRHGRDLVVNVHTRVNDDVANPNNVAPKWRTITSRDAYQSIVIRLERIRMAFPGITEAAAEVECQKELEALGFSGSIGRIRDAKEFVKAQRERVA